MTKVPALKVSGRLILENEAKANGRSALRLKSLNPEVDGPDLLFLRFAFVIMGTEEPLYPRFLIDDWGGEVRGLGIYRWVKENGNQFPRAEIFGCNAQGEETQFFLRELELYAKLPCAVFPDREAPLTAGVPLQAILQPDKTVEEPKKIKRPSQLKRPLSAARVSWWQIPSTYARFDFNLLDKAESPDFI